MALDSSLCGFAREEKYVGHIAWTSIQFCCTLCADASLLSLSLACAILIRIGTSHFLALPYFNPLSHTIFQYLVCVLLVLGILFYEGLYGTDPLHFDQTPRIIKALTGGLIATTLYTFAIHNQDLSRFVLFLWYALSVLVFTLIRPLLSRRLLLIGPSRFVIVAGDEQTMDLIRPLRLESLGVEIAPSSTQINESFPTATASHASLYIRTLTPGKQWESDLDQMESRYGGIGMIPADTDLTIMGGTPVNMCGLQVFVIHHPLSRRFNQLLKRIIDITASVTLLALLLPVYLAIAFAIRLDSPGPIFYGHKRLGQNGRYFKAWKFRSMAVNADQLLQQLLSSNSQLREEYAATFKLRKDPRVTKVGRFLRRTSLDELPQLWNVVKGEMSLVGPRPIVDAEKPLYGKAYSIVSTVRPGITGLWQTSGRNEVRYAARKHFDTYYVRNWSLWMDLSIIVRTIQAVVLPGDY